MDFPQRIREFAAHAAAGDEVALTVLLTQLEEPLRARLHCRVPADLRTVIDENDLLQLVYTDIFRGIRGFAPRADNALERWVSTIALRRLRAEIRRLRADKRGGGRVALPRPGANSNESVITLLSWIEATERTPSRAAASLETAQAVQDALLKLPEACREAVRLVYVEGLAVAEAARRIGRSERAVHNLCHKAKTLLRDLLGPSDRFLSSR